jgi:EF-P beta-lysylation protein EpmB
MTIVTNRQEIVAATSPSKDSSAHVVFSGKTDQKQPSAPANRWQEEMKVAFRDPVTLCNHLGLADSWLPGAIAASEQFPLFVTRPYVERMEKGNPADPLLRQVLPLGEELAIVPGYSTDPVDDAAAVAAPGLLQKYAGRALMITTGACAVHCRYCFRRHFPYSESPTGFADWQPALDAIRKDKSLDEIILSGGDPLTLTDAKLSQLICAIDQISHVTRLRIHTRLPIFIPNRVTDAFVELLRSLRSTPVIVLHCNHANEIDAGVAVGVKKLRQAGAMLLNQAVLLRGVNDNTEVLANLSKKLATLRVQPYYLHQLDRTQGAAHFEVPISVGRELMRKLGATLPGYLVPKYVQEIPGGTGKEFIPV